MDKLTKEQRKMNLRAIKSKGLKIELLFGKAMWVKGLRYRKNDNAVMGKPYFTFKNDKDSVFYDSEFWHEKDWGIKKQEHNSNIKFWLQEIERIIERDMDANIVLSNNVWKVLSFWGEDINKELLHCMVKV